MNSLLNILSLGFLKDGLSISLIPSKIIRYTRKREVQLPPVDADSILVDEAASQTLRNKQLTLPKVNENAPLTATSTELNQLDGINLQAELDSKQQDVISARGDLVVGDLGGGPSKLAIGTDGQVLTSDGATAGWEALPATPTATLSVQGIGYKKPVARYRQTSAQALTAGSDTIIDFSSADFDSASAVTTGPNWKFTAPRTGYYKIHARMMLNGSVPFNGTTNPLGLLIYKNGSLYSYDERRPYANEQYAFITISDVVQLNAGQYVDVRLGLSAGLMGVTLYGSSVSNRISIEMIEDA